MKNNSSFNFLTLNPKMDQSTWILIYYKPNAKCGEIFGNVVGKSKVS
jgi:hypothetical protein